MKLSNISFNYGTKKIYENFTVEFPENRITCILGPSGCGKTTLLNIISGSLDYSGEINKESDNIGYIFQTPVLLNHLTIWENINIVLKKKVKNTAKRNLIINQILKKVDLLNDKDSYPFSLSGGMAQRVSIARAFAYNPDILLMDEPFKGLDLSLKKHIITIFKELYSEKKITVIMVTHDIDEALLLSDNIIILNQNKIIYQKEIIKTNRTISDFPDIRSEIYQLL